MLATIILAFSILLGQPIEIDFSNKIPSDKKELPNDPPDFLIT